MQRVLVLPGAASSAVTGTVLAVYIAADIGGSAASTFAAA